MLQASKLALVDEVKAALEGVNDTFNDLSQRDAQDRTSLHLLAASGKDDCIDLVLAKAGQEAAPLIALQDKEGDTPLHLCSHCPMVCYQLAAQAPAICLTGNKAGVTPVDLAFKHGTGEALNALLLACSGSSTPESLEAMRTLTRKGAVPDTWAPNGQSSLMLAAAADSAEGVELLLGAGASPELQDAMGRTALMWAAGSGAVAALKALLAADVSVAVRDRRGRTASDYAEQPEVKSVLVDRVNELEVKAAAAQEALLAELLEEEERKLTTKAAKKAKKKAKAKEKKKGTTPTPSDDAAVERTSLEAQSSAQVKSREHYEAEEADEELAAVAVTAGVSPVIPTAHVVAAPCSSPMKGAWQRGPPIVSPTSYGNVRTSKTHTSEEVPMPVLPSGTDAMASGGCTTDEDCATRSSTPPGPAPASLPARPPSPEWCTVVKKDLKPASKTIIDTRSSTVASSATFASVSHRGVGTTKGAGSHHGHHRRSPSAGSVASASSVGSQETDSSKHSGSERSVLRRPGGVVVNNTSAAHQTNNTSSLVGPRLPAPFQKKAVISRSASGGGDDVSVLVAGGMLLASGDGGGGASGGALPSGTPSIALAPSASPSSPPCVSKQGTWASVAAQQIERTPSKAGTTAGMRLTANSAATAVVPVATASLPKATKPAWGPSATATQRVPKTQQQAEASVPSPIHLREMPESAFKSSTMPSSLVSPMKRAPASVRVPALALEPSAPPPPSTTSASGEATPTAAAAAMAAAAAAHQAAAEEVSVLRGEIQRLRMKNTAAELAHHQELAAVLHDASQHEAAAVAKATSDERMACTVRFASLLQNNGVALASVIPGLLVGAGISTALDLDIFLSSIANNTAGNTASPHGVQGPSLPTAGAPTNLGTGNEEADVLAAMGFRQLTHSSSVSASQKGSGNLLVGAAAAAAGTAVAPHSVTAPINMAPHSHPAATGITSSTGGMTAVASGGSGGLFESSPLSTSPFSFEVGEHLRGDFLGNHSAFVMPAVDNSHAGHAMSPSRGSADSMRSATAAAAAAAWGVSGAWADGSR